MSDRRAALLWLIGLPIVAAGCATAPLAPPGGAPADVFTTRWSGRFSLTMTEPGVEPREERASGRFLLETIGGQTRLELSSPLGQTLASATLAGDSARLTTAEGRLFEADSAEQLTEEVLGWRMPIGKLPNWLRGTLEAPTEMNAGRPVAGREHGWAIRLGNWRPAGPSRLTLDWPAQPDASRRKLTLKLIVDEAS